MGIIMVYKPTYNWGAPSCMCIEFSYDFGVPQKIPQVTDDYFSAAMVGVAFLPGSWGLWADPILNVKAFEPPVFHEMG